MTAPTGVSVSVDLTEYSRFEHDKNTIHLDVLPAIPTTDIAVAIPANTSLITVGNSAVFPAPPFDIRISTGANQETLTVTGRLGNQLSTSTPTVFPHAVCEIVVEPIDLTGEVIMLELVKGRRNRDVVVATEQLIVPGPDPIHLAAQFFLPSIVDDIYASRVRRGDYFVRATSVTNPDVTGVSPDFLISVITVDRFKREWLHGVDYQALETETVKFQPQLVRGVTVSFVSRGHEKGWIPLSYNYSDPGGCGTPVRLISWCDGPSIAIHAGKTTYTLRKGRSQSDYIDVTIPSIDALPTVSTAEDLLIDREPLSDSFFREKIRAAINWVEKTALMCFIEPTRVVTEIDPNEITFAQGTDIPTWVQSDWDERVNAVTYVRPSPGHWINFRMPYYPTLKFYQLYGKVSNVRIVDIALEWIEIDEPGGFVELVPFNQEIAFNFIGLIWVESLRGPVPIPNFWNWDALVGYRTTPDIIIELIGKKAAIEALTLAGQAFRPGISSQSVSRDGVSESVSYLTQGRYGIFSATITTYTEWIDKNLPMLRGAYKGVNMLVV